MVAITHKVSILEILIFFSQHSVSLFHEGNYFSIQKHPIENLCIMFFRWCIFRLWVTPERILRKSCACDVKSGCKLRHVRWPRPIQFNSIQFNSAAAARQTHVAVVCAAVVVNSSETPKPKIQNFTSLLFQSHQQSRPQSTIANRKFRVWIWRLGPTWESRGLLH